MGGFAVDTSATPCNFLPENRTRLTLTAKGLCKLAIHEPDLIPDISQNSITDKSKANELAKAVVCLQALWFCIQIFARLCSSLPISVLELNTFAHALCCLAVYLLWWNKPHDIDEPSLIPVLGNRNEKICALMVMESRIGAFRECHTLNNNNSTSESKETSFRGVLVFKKTMGSLFPIPAPRDSEDIRVSDLNDSTETAMANQERLGLRETVDVGIETCTNLGPVLSNISSAQLNHTPKSQSDQKLRIYDQSNGFMFADAFVGSNPSIGWVSNTTKEFAKDLFITLQPWDEKCLELAGAAYEENFPHQEPKSSNVSAFYRDLTDSLVTRASNVPFLGHGSIWTNWTRILWSLTTIIWQALALGSINPEGEIRASWGVRPLITHPVMGLIITGSIYGGLHLLAWNAPFTTRVELFLWRTSACILIVPLLLFFCLISLVGLCYILKDWLVCRDVQRWTMFLHSNLLCQQNKWVCAYTFVLLLYISARVCLVVEGVVNLAHLPHEVYQVPSLSLFFPHFVAG